MELLFFNARFFPEYINVIFYWNVESRFLRSEKKKKKRNVGFDIILSGDLLSDWFLLRVCRGKWTGRVRRSALIQTEIRAHSRSRFPCIASSENRWISRKSWTTMTLAKRLGQTLPDEKRLYLRSGTTFTNYKYPHRSTTLLHAVADRGGWNNVHPAAVALRIYTALRRKAWGVMEK